MIQRKPSASSRRSAKAAASTCRSARPSSPEGSAWASTSSAFHGWSTARRRADASAATRINRREFAPAQQEQARTQSAPPVYPAPHGGGISLQHDFGGFGFGVHPPLPVDRSRGMESQARPARHADAVLRH